MKKSLFPYFLSTSLLLLTLGAAVIGYFAYRNLNQIVSTLEEEVKPNLDLIILGQISIELGRMEDAIEGYVFNQDTSYMADFKARTQNAMAHLGELRLRSADYEFSKSIDSLENLILNKVTVLNQAAHLDMFSVEETFASIPRFEETKKDTVILIDTVVSNQKKIGFLQKLLGKKEVEVITTDSTVIVEERPTVDVNLQLDSIARKAQKRAYNQKIREFTLYKDHQDIDAEIVALIKRMETWQITRIKQMALQTQDRVRFTNRYITIFSFMASVILFITLTMLIIYVLRTRSHQMVLNLAKQNALQTAKEKEEFLANMSHEIRTPMNAIAGFAKTLLNSNLSAQQLEQVSIIDKSSNHLIHILNDVLDFSKLQSGKIKLDITPFDPEIVIKEAVQLLSQKAEEKGLRLKCEVSSLPKCLSGDAFRLRQILLNLIFNSIKFTESGEISVRATSVIREDKTYLQIDISDTGIGIPPDRQALVFDEFEQVNGSDKQTGTGLGLTITKKLIDIHQGSIRLQSVVGEGTTFSIELPYEELEPNEEELKSNNHSDFDFLGVHLLIADDEPFNVKLLKTILDAQNISYDVGIDGQATYELLSRHKYDLLLLDFRMPKMSGPEVASLLRKEGGINAGIPILGLTATVSDQHLKTAVDSGIDQIIRKPFKPEDLLRAMADQLKTRSFINSSGGLIKKKRPQQFSLDGLHQMGDEFFVMDMVETFISSSQKNLEMLDREVNTQNWEGAADVLHRIIAPARHFKLTELVHLLKETELSARRGTPIPRERLGKIKEETLSVIESLQLYLQQTQI
ncbi:ATP-binding protein [Reichenbachiella agarivorans]|uniref:histidine kinase n=1 Tax=Reichenbachiella agarivorans TaxID=2979464 RepID=A0ABY6CP62_9BACT|nr:ATP-binding protein [Reichenbachiella agarivorans]UXP32164.1 ATP-binding protein [Reichenbachiella agarivorans]